MRWLLLLPVLSGCPLDDVDLPDPPDDLVGRIVSFVPEVEVEPEAFLPALPNGNSLLVRVPFGQVEYDPTQEDALTALGACTQWIVSCVEPGARSLDDCFRSAPACETEEPWKEETCCPEACYEQYADKRRSGVQDFPAFDQVFFVESTCINNLSTLLENGR